MSRGRKRPTPRPDAATELTSVSLTDLPPWPELPDLEQRLAELVSQIPSGRVATYGALALALGSIKASPWIATVLDRARFADLPTHRVVAATGQVRRGHPGQGLSPAEKLLAEGVLFRRDQVLLEHSLWQPVAVSPPLQPLSAYQSACADWLRQQTPPGAKL